MLNANAVSIPIPRKPWTRNKQTQTDRQTDMQDKNSILTENR